MNKLCVYVVRDALAGQNELILTAKNDGLLKRSIKGILLSREQNFINTDTKDKDVYHCADLDIDTGVITGLQAPAFVFNVEQLRLELVAEIRAQRVAAGLEEVKEDDEEDIK